MKGGGVTIKKEEDVLFPFRTKSHQSIKNSLQVAEVTDAVLLVLWIGMSSWVLSTVYLSLEIEERETLLEFQDV